MPRSTHPVWSNAVSALIGVCSLVARRALYLTFPLLLVSLLLGCASRDRGARYAEVLHAPAQPRDVALRIQRPSDECLQRVQQVLPPGSLYDALPAGMHAGYSAVLRSLHPVAKQVLRRTGGVWFARQIDNAGARFVPCDAGERRGWIVIDTTSTPAGDDTADMEVPYRYWQLLGGMSEVEHAATALASSRRDHRAARYVVSHELGHALSLMTGEFTLDDRGQFSLDSWDGFAAFSWRGQREGALGAALHEAGGVVPSRLALSDWRQVRRALDSDATWLAPGYRTRSRLDDLLSCDMVEALPRAGFVTPAAATSPIEDYAELFAHALLADEGKIHPDDALHVQLPGCEGSSLSAPYAAPGVRAKRAYIERHLGLR